VFRPAGITSATIAPVADDALAYPIPATGPGWESDPASSLFYMTGSAGWHFTAHELLEIMAAFRRGDTIVPGTWPTPCSQTGLASTGSPRRRHATIYTKNGYWETTSAPVQSAYDGTEQATASFLPNDMELVVLVNSRIDPAGTQNISTLMDQLVASNMRALR
jgi:CubicO group peptidase (beta-lactamase class C family)